MLLRRVMELRLRVLPLLPQPCVSVRPADGLGGRCPRVEGGRGTRGAIPSQGRCGSNWLQPWHVKMTASWQIESEIATPYLLYISDGCAEGRCSRGKFGYKLESLFFFFFRKKRWWYICNCWMYISELSDSKNSYLFIDSFQLCLWNQVVYSWAARLNILTFNVNALTYWAVGCSTVFCLTLVRKNHVLISVFKAYWRILFEGHWTLWFGCFRMRESEVNWHRGGLWWKGCHHYNLELQRSNWSHSPCGLTRRFFVGESR